MAGSAGKSAGRRPRKRTAKVASSSGAWQLQEAKARFSEVAKRAQDGTPQRVTVRGQPAVVVVAAKQYEKLVGPQKHRPLGQYLASFGPLLGQRETLFERAGDLPRDVDL